MFESFIAALPQILAQLATPEVMLCLFMGAFGGMVIGALPGLSATMGIALMIPFTYGLSPVAAISMLMAIYTSAIAGGSISAILIHTPGTPSSAATALDGYPLTLQGKGLLALGTAMTSSMIGGTMSALALLCLAPILAAFSLKFGSPEYFLLACFGLCIIASLASDSLVKGLIAGCLGLIFCTVGIDNDSAFPRFTFGGTHLLEGFPVVPALIGLFSIPQVLTQLQKARNVAKNPEKLEIGEIKGSILPPWKEFKALIPTIIRSGLIGVGVGILPGAGGDIGSWVGYNEAKRFSKNKELFGKGSLEGVCASETANNAVTGGAMIPMLTLGIPGSAAAAVLMGGLMIQGMLPGGTLFTEKAPITYAIILGFLLSNFMMGIIGLIMARYAVKITRVPPGILCPIIVVLSIIGSYAISQSMYNVYVMIVFGFLGYFMKQTGIPASGMVLALILGPMAETGLRESIVLAQGNLLGYFMGRPISVVLFGFIILGVFLPLYLEKRKKKGDPAMEQSPDNAH